MLICSCQASTTDSLSFSFFSSLEEEGLSVSQPPQSHQQERIGLRQLELNPGLNPSDTGGGGRHIHQTTTSRMTVLTGLGRDYKTEGRTKGD